MALTLILARHAHAESANFSDLDRPLSSRGATAASQLGHLLASRFPSIDAIIASKALRTTQTAQYIAQSGHLSCPLTTSSFMYDGGTDGYLLEASSASAQIKTLLLVGHNPTISLLTWELCGENVTFPPATCAAIALDHLDTWQPLLRSRGELGRLLCSPSDIANALI